MDIETTLRYSWKNEDFVKWWREYRNKTVLSHGKFEDDGFGEIVRFIYCKGEKYTYYGKISNITRTGRVIADAGGISVHQGIKIERIKGCYFTPVSSDVWVMMCFKADEKYSSEKFDFKVAKLERTLEKKMAKKENKDSFLVFIKGMSTGIYLSKKLDKCP